MLRLRKPHACGGSEWRVERLGADIGLRCLQCRRRVLLDRPTVERRTRAVIAATEPPASADELAPTRYLGPGPGQP